MLGSKVSSMKRIKLETTLQHLQIINYLSNGLGAKAFSLRDAYEYIRRKV